MIFDEHKYAPNHGLAKGAYGSAFSDTNELAKVQKAIKVLQIIL